jgi:hypothetical protein
MGAELLQSGLAGVTEAAALPLLQHVLMREPEAILLLVPHLLLFSQFPLPFLVEAEPPIGLATSLLR